MNLGIQRNITINKTNKWLTMSHSKGKIYMNDKIKKLEEQNMTHEIKIEELQEKIKVRNKQIEEIRINERIGALNIIETQGIDIDKLLKAIKSGNKQYVQDLMNKQKGEQI